MTIQEIFRQAEVLPTAERWRLVRHLLDTLEEERSSSPQSDWQVRLQATYGILADAPIEIPPDLPFTERESID